MPSPLKSNDSGAIRSLLNLIRFGKKKVHKVDKSDKASVPVVSAEPALKPVAAQGPPDAPPGNDAPSQEKGTEAPPPQCPVPLSLNGGAPDAFKASADSPLPTGKQGESPRATVSNHHANLLAALESTPQGADPCSSSAHLSYNVNLADLSGVLFSRRTCNRSHADNMPARVAQDTASAEVVDATATGTLQRHLDDAVNRGSYVPYGTTTVGPLHSTALTTQDGGFGGVGNSAPLCTVPTNVLQDMLYADYETLDRLQQGGHHNQRGALGDRHSATTGPGPAGRASAGGAVGGATGLRPSGNGRRDAKPPRVPSLLGPGNGQGQGLPQAGRGAPLAGLEEGLGADWRTSPQQGQQQQLAGVEEVRVDGRAAAGDAPQAQPAVPLDSAGRAGLGTGPGGHVARALVGLEAVQQASQSAPLAKVPFPREPGEGRTVAPQSAAQQQTRDSLAMAPAAAPRSGLGGTSRETVAPGAEGPIRGGTDDAQRQSTGLVLNRYQPDSPAAAQRQAVAPATHGSLEEQVLAAERTGPPGTPGAPLSPALARSTVNQAGTTGTGVLGTVAGADPSHRTGASSTAAGTPVHGSVMEEAAAQGAGAGAARAEVVAAGRTGLAAAAAAVSGGAPAASAQPSPRAAAPQPQTQPSPSMSVPPLQPLAPGPVAAAAPGDHPAPLGRPMKLTTACLAAYTTLYDNGGDQSFHRALQRKMQAVYKWLHASDLTAPPDPRLEVPLPSAAPAGDQAAGEGTAAAGAGAAAPLAGAQTAVGTGAGGRRGSGAAQVEDAGRAGALEAESAGKAVAADGAVSAATAVGGEGRSPLLAHGASSTPGPAGDRTGDPLRDHLLGQQPQPQQLARGLVGYPEVAEPGQVAAPPDHARIAGQQQSLHPQQQQQFGHLHLSPRQRLQQQQSGRAAQAMEGRMSIAQFCEGAGDAIATAPHGGRGQLLLRSLEPHHHHHHPHQQSPRQHLQHTDSVANQVPYGDAAYGHPSHAQRGPGGHSGPGGVAFRQHGKPLLLHGAGSGAAGAGIAADSGLTSGDPSGASGAAAGGGGVAGAAGGGGAHHTDASVLQHSLSDLYGSTQQGPTTANNMPPRVLAGSDDAISAVSGAPVLTAAANAAAATIAAATATTVVTSASAVAAPSVGMPESAPGPYCVAIGNVYGSGAGAAGSGAPSSPSKPLPAVKASAGGAGPAGVASGSGGGAHTSVRTKTIAVASHCPPELQPLAGPQQAIAATADALSGGMPGAGAGGAASSSLTGSWSIDDFSLLKKLYEGSLSVVCQAQHRRSGRHVALKIYKRSRLHEMERFQLAREICLHIRIVHPHVVALFAAWKDSKYVYLALDWAPQGNMFDFLVSRGGRLGEEEAARLVMRPLMSALAFLHSQHFIHRDIKLENLLLDASFNLKLADFGLAIDQKFEQANTRLGTFGYFAPEVLDCPLKKGPFDLKDSSVPGYDSRVDVWSAGVVGYEVLTGRAPFSASSPSKIIQAIRSRVLDFPGISEEGQDFLRAALTRDAAARPTAKQLLNHPWIVRHCGPAAGAAGLGSPRTLLPVPSPRQSQPCGPEGLATESGGSRAVAAADPASSAGGVQ